MDQKSFENLKVWQDSRCFAKELFLILSEKKDNRAGYLINHASKTAGRIMDNIAEGYERNGNKELIQFLSISKGSAGEMRSQLYRLLDLEIITKIEFNELINKIQPISIQLSKFISYLKNSDFKGSKFKKPTVEYSNDISFDSFFL